MFTSKEHLHNNLGVDENIARFFVDRKVPENNRYWKGKYLYVAGGTGYLFIPIFFDLQYKCGASRDSLLNEDYVQLMEAILDSAALYEFEEIDFPEHLENCKTVLTNRVINVSLYDDLLTYFNNENLAPYKNLGTRSKSLNRGDTFLFSLCNLELGAATMDKMLESWYALVPSFLLMDDISDFHQDKKNNEENSIAEFGEGSEGIDNAIKFLRNKFNQLKNYNNKLGCYFEKSLEKKLQTAEMQSLLNNY